MSEPLKIPLKGIFEPGSWKIPAVWCCNCGKWTRPGRCKDPVSDTICGHCLKRVGLAFDTDENPIEFPSYDEEHDTYGCTIGGKYGGGKEEEAMIRDLGVNSWEEVMSQSLPIRGPW